MSGSGRAPRRRAASIPCGGSAAPAWPSPMAAAMATVLRQDDPEGSRDGRIARLQLRSRSPTAVAAPCWSRQMRREPSSMRRVASFPSTRRQFRGWRRTRPTGFSYPDMRWRQERGGTALADWFAARQAANVVFDPSPLVRKIAPDDPARVLSRTTWLTCNADEAQALSPSPTTPRRQCGAGQRICPGAGVVLRMSAEGCLLRLPMERLEHVRASRRKLSIRRAPATCIPAHLSPPWRPERARSGRDLRQRGRGHQRHAARRRECAGTA